MKMKQYLITGYAMLLCIILVSCSSKDVYDENYVQKTEDAKRTAKYEEAFTQAFGQVYQNHHWGFDQTTGSQTRTAVTSTTDQWIIPDNLMGGAQNKEGWNANTLDAAFQKKDQEGGISSTLSDFDFSNYFLQHVEKPDGGKIKQSISHLEAYNSSTGQWETVTNFSRGQNNSSFELLCESTYFYAPLNRSAKGATLMKEMGGGADASGHQFRVAYDDGTYNYNYGFLTLPAYHKESGEWIPAENFLAFQFPPKNSNKGNSYWVIRLGEGKTAATEVFAEGRVLCEDMGANDFDFNDVVFDAYIMKNGDLKIVVLAHGGVLDISVAGVPVSLGKMTNTGEKTDATQSFTILAANHNYTSINQIPVEVFPNGFADNLNSFPLEAIVGQVPQKVCAPIGTHWPDEYVKISKAYTSFTTWVRENNPAKWTYVTVPRLVDLLLSNNADDYVEP